MTVCQSTLSPGPYLCRDVNDDPATHPSHPVKSQFSPNIVPVKKSRENNIQIKNSILFYRFSYGCMVPNPRIKSNFSFSKIFLNFIFEFKMFLNAQ